MDATIPRAEIFLAQTPQIFRRTAFLAALARAVPANEEFTDDAAVAEAAGIPVEVVPGEADNLKITYPDDLARAERILASRAGSPPIPRFGSGAGSMSIGSSRGVARGGRRRDRERCRAARPQATATPSLHALADAILGAAGLEDLGTLFPDTDPNYRDADSRDLLRRCVERAAAAGFRVVNADCVVVVEKPKLAPHRAAIRASVASILGSSLERVEREEQDRRGAGPRRRWARARRHMHGAPPVRRSIGCSRRRGRGRLALRRGEGAPGALVGDAPGPAGLTREWTTRRFGVTWEVSRKVEAEDLKWLASTGANGIVQMPFPRQPRPDEPVIEDPDLRVWVSASAGCGRPRASRASTESQRSCKPHLFIGEPNLGALAGRHPPAQHGRLGGLVCQLSEDDPSLRGARGRGGDGGVLRGRRAAADDVVRERVAFAHRRRAARLPRRGDVQRELG